MKIIFLIALLIATALLISCDDGGGGPASTETVASAKASPELEASPTPLLNVCQTNPDPATPDVLVIDQPLPFQGVTSPFTVSGRIAAFEATFKITIFDAAGNSIVDVVAMSEEGQTLSPFSEDVTFSVSQPTPACLWVYEASARDGSPIHVGQLPTTLQP